MEADEYLQRIEPELMNITRVFGIADEVWKETSGIKYTVSQCGDNIECCFKWGETEQRARGVLPSESDERLSSLHRKRTARRLVKQVCYDICRKKTGIHPPWGSSTGVRPTHLLYEQLSFGKTMDEAEKAVVSQFDIAPEKANLLRRIVEVQQTMLQPDEHMADVYIGIPFCTTRCSYCSFSSGEIGDGSLTEPYLSALFSEMEFTAELLKSAGKKLRCVYVGGGTPTALSAKQLDRLLGKLLVLFHENVELTVEAGRPDTLTDEKLRLIAEAGVNRISINPQTMNERTLKIIGRNHTPQQVREAYALARKAGINHINMDVIAGLPGESLDDFAVTMDAALNLRPESLTVHTLTIKRSSRMSLEESPLPDGATAEAMVKMGMETAGKMGMQPYYMYRQKHMAGNQENVGYSLPGHTCIYNVDMMEENSNVLAVGSGAISKRVYPDEGHIERAPNVSNIEEYIKRVDEMKQRKAQLFLNI